MTPEEAVARAERTLQWRPGQAAVSVEVDVLTALVAVAREVAGRPKLAPAQFTSPMARALRLPQIAYEWRHHCGALLTTRDGEPTPHPCPVCGEQQPIYWLLNSWLCAAE